MPDRESATAEARLERLLHVLPAAAVSAAGVPLQELADELGVPPALLLEDLHEATARSYYQPAGSGEEFTILLEGDRVAVFAPHDFRRPVRLNERESIALELGLRVLAAEVEGERREEVLELARRLGRCLTVRQARTVQEQRRGESDVEYEPQAAEAVQLALDDDGFRGAVAEAIERGCLCTLDYLKPGGGVAAPRRVAPYRLVYADGLWYLVAHDCERAACRIFRLDRALDVRLEPEPAAGVPPVDVAALLREGVPYIANDDVEVRVRYSPRVTPWIREQVAAECLADGSVRVRHRVADLDWIVRHVLQYAGDAVIETPPEVRARVRQVALELAR